MPNPNITAINLCKIEDLLALYEGNHTEATHEYLLFCFDMIYSIWIISVL